MLGSGLGRLVDLVSDPVVVPFQDLPGFPPLGVVGHRGAFVGGSLGGTSVLVQAGRYHLYEGHSIDQVVAPVRLAAAIGVRRLLLTNASGGIREDLEPGNLLVVEDHLNLQFQEPVGRAIAPAPRVLYDAGLRDVARAAAGRLGIDLRSGVYAAVLGPSYETPAEIRMLRRMGADVVGMSTVPEVLAAAQEGVACLALSLVTNKAAGLGHTPLSHSDVVETGRGAAERTALLVEGLVGADQSTGAK